ncbi:MAG: DUF1772 domain-containing protein [Cyclobacteriaceae bacterium]|nr:DUF1772 domain-containing protein [Cyclobacteriaceae bacterium]
MIIPLLLFLTLLAYSMVVSQSFMYLLSLRHASLGLDANGYLALRKLVDGAMRANFKYVVYGSLLSSLALTVTTAGDPGSLLFLTSAIAFAALIIDLVITMKGNMPINDAINTWKTDAYPADWADYRAKWLTYYGYRQVVNITGFLCLLIGTVFK